MTDTEPGYYEARRMGGGMVLLFERHDTYGEARQSAEQNKVDGQIRHFVVQLIPLEAAQPPQGEP